jgi:hypothetical protein
MRGLFMIPLLALILPASANSAPAPDESWGKAGVSLAQYRQDALDCALKGHYLDISKTDDAKAFVKASRELDAITTGASAPAVAGANGMGSSTTDSSVDQMVEYANQQQHIVESVRPDQRFHSIKRMLVDRTSQCLASRGYSKFRLTDEQRRQLRKLKFGSEERRVYLYNLGSNPAVLQSQSVGANP